MDLKHYLIISNICLALSYILFRLLNRDETMFRKRRLFIIISVLLSLALPLSGLRIQLPHLTGTLPVYNNIADETINFSTQADETGILKNNGTSILYFYLIITGVIVLNILFQLIRVIWYYLSSDKKEGNIIKVNSRRLSSPFSFFKWIFIPGGRVREDDLESIIIHESVHGRELHTVDNIILEIACAILWFNPFIWLLKNSLHLIHEYLADEGTIHSGIEKTCYQSLLVNQVAEEKLVNILSGFNNNLLKKRLIMMTKNKIEGSNRYRILSILPLTIVLFITMGLINGLSAQESKSKSDQKKVMVIGYGKPDPSINYIVDGVYAKDIDNINPDSIESVNVLKDDKTIIVRTKSYSPKSGDVKDPKIIINSVDGKSNNILLIVDGKEVSKETFEKIPPDDIKSISVLKGESKDIYTKKDVDGVMVVTTKK